MRSVAIHQPCYIPYLGFFYKLWKADVFVFLDDAQYTNNGWIDYNNIKVSSGASCRLRIPIRKNFGQRILDTSINNNVSWKEKHLETIRCNYVRAPFFKQVFSDYGDIVNSERENLADLNESLILMLTDRLGWNMRFLKSSKLEVHGKKQDRVIDIVSSIGGTRYISGIGAKAYQNESAFIQKGIQLEYAGIPAVSYPQLWGDFVPNLSIIDACMNIGYEGTARMIEGMDRDEHKC